MRRTKFSKVLLASFIVLVLAFSFALTGCSSDQKTSSKGNSDSKVIHLKYWVPFSGGDGDFMKAMVDKFNQSHKDIQIDMLNLKSEEYYTKLSTAILAKKGPDIAIGHASRLQELVFSGEIQDITDLADKAGIDWSTYNENIMKSTVIDGKHYAVPNDTHALIMFYNKKILKDAGLLDGNGQPAIQPGPDGFISYLEQIQSKVGKGIMPFSATSSGNLPYWMWFALYSQEGGNLLTDDMKKADFNNDKGVKALELIDQMVKEELWPKNIKNGGEIFAANKAAINFNGVWSTGTFEKNSGLDFAAVPIPQIYDQKATWGDSHTYVIPVQTNPDEKKEVAALKFAKWLTDNGSMWAKAGHVPAETAVVNSKEFKDLPYRHQYAEVANYVTYLPKSTQLNSINDIMIADINLVMTGQLSPKDALKKAEQEVNSKLAK